MAASRQVTAATLYVAGAGGACKAQGALTNRARPRPESATFCRSSGATLQERATLGEIVGAMGWAIIGAQSKEDGFALVPLGGFSRLRHFLLTRVLIQASTCSSRISRGSEPPPSTTSWKAFSVSTLKRRSERPLRPFRAPRRSAACQSCRRSLPRLDDVALDLRHHFALGHAGLLLHVGDGPLRARPAVVVDAGVDDEAHCAKTSRPAAGPGRRRDRPIVEAESLAIKQVLDEPCSSRWRVAALKTAPRGRRTSGQRDIRARARSRGRL